MWEDEDELYGPGGGVAGLPSMPGYATPNPAPPFEGIEDIDLYGPTGGVESLRPMPGYAPPTARRPDPRIPAMERLAEYRRSRPNINDERYQPGLGNRIAAAAATFGDTYVNMGGRTRTNPEAIGGLQDELLRPGYSRDARAWEDEGFGVMADVDLANQEAAIALQEEADDLRRQQAETAAVTAGRQADYWDWRRSHEEAAGNMPRTFNTPGGLIVERGDKFETIPGSEPPPRQPAGRNRTPEDVLMDPASTADQKSAAQRIIDKKYQRQPREDNPNAITPGERRQTRFDRIDDWKQAELMTAEGDARKAAEKADAAVSSMLSGEARRKAIDKATAEKKKIWEDLERKKKLIQQSYESRIRARGGSVPASAPRAETPPAMAAQAQSGRMRVRIKATGQTGSVDAVDFDPATMEAVGN
jgi:hypothetical protein